MISVEASMYSSQLANFLPSYFALMSAKFSAFLLPQEERPKIITAEIANNNTFFIIIIF